MAFFMTPTPGFYQIQVLFYRDNHFKLFPLYYFGSSYAYCIQLVKEVTENTPNKRSMTKNTLK